MDESPETGEAPSPEAETPEQKQERFQRILEERLKKKEDVEKEHGLQDVDRHGDPWEIEPDPNPDNSQH